MIGPLLLSQTFENCIEWWCSTTQSVGPNRNTLAGSTMEGVRSNPGVILEFIPSQGRWELTWDKVELLPIYFFEEFHLLSKLAF